MSCNTSLCFVFYSSNNAFFWFQDIRRWCTVNQYYFVQYGIDLTLPETNLFRILPSFCLEEDEITSDNLFPMELIQLDSNFYPLSFYSWYLKILFFFMASRFSSNKNMWNRNVLIPKYCFWLLKQFRRCYLRCMKFFPKF